MAKPRSLVSLIIALAFLAVCVPIPAFAQFGVGFGAWNWGGNHTGYGSWFGFSMSPYGRSHYTAPTPRLESSKKQANGYLEGQVLVQSVCPASQADVACPLIPNALDNVTVTAQPDGSSQWIVSQPNAQGYYNLSLPPGRYTITANHPSLSRTNEMSRSITIQPRQTLHQDFQIALPMQ